MAIHCARSSDLLAILCRRSRLFNPRRTEDSSFSLRSAAPLGSSASTLPKTAPPSIKPERLQGCGINLTAGGVHADRVLGKATLLILVFVLAALLGLKKYQGGHVADALMKEADESDEEILDILIRREAEGAAKKLGVSQAEAENAIRQEWDEGKLQSARAFSAAVSTGKCPAAGSIG
jgi:hypothetical protein